MATPPQASTFTDQPVYWFVVLELALDQGDLEQAARAKSELARLGVEVTHRRQRRTRSRKGVTS
jgi:hypothetical protein